MIIDALVRDLARVAAYPVFITGAGVSRASGIPTFRGTDPGAVWTNDVLEMGTFSFFMKDPVAQWKWYLERFDVARKAVPNAAHHAIAGIESLLVSRGRRCVTVTQNIDGLHRAAGSNNLLEVHGSAHYLRCSEQLCEYGEPNGKLPWDDALFYSFRATSTENNIPKCPSCGANLRAHVLWFDEMYTGHKDYRYKDVEHVFQDTTCFVFVGTSFSVGITETALVMGEAFKIPMYLIDLAESSPTPCVKLIRGKAEEVLPDLLARLARVPKV